MAALGRSLVRADVAIAGGGVAGASLAAVLARAGVRVAVVEREPRFRDRVRGESIHPWGMMEASRLHVLPVLQEAGARELPVWQRYEERSPVPPYRWADDTPGGFAEWTVSHPALQETMLGHAAAHGALVIRPARVSAYTRAGRPELEVQSAGTTITVQARLLVGADGSRSMARRWLNAQAERDPVHHAIGGSLLDGVVLDEGAAHQAIVPGHMVVVFPQGAGRARAYIVYDLDTAAGFRGPRGAEAFVRACAALLPEGALDRAVPTGPTAFFPNADIWSSKVAGDDIVLIGDAAGANDPSQGQGLSIVFHDVRVLSDLLLTESDWSRALMQYATYRAASFDVLRTHARWAAQLITETGPEADARRERVARARKQDPTAGGFATIFATGPEGLVANEATRRRFFSEEDGFNQDPSSSVVLALDDRSGGSYP